MKAPFLIKENGDPFRTKKKVSYDTGQAFTKMTLQNVNYIMLQFNAFIVKAICDLCADNTASAAQRSIFDDIVTAQLKKVLTPNKRKSQRRKLGMDSDYDVV